MANPESHRLASKRYDDANRDKRRAYYLANRERLLAQNKKWRTENSERDKARKAKYNRDYPERVKAANLRKYSLSLDEFLRLKAEQGDACAICRRVVGLQVDHDHDTGRVRALLCPKCNNALGKLERTVLPIGLEIFLAYLGRTKERE